MADDEFLDNIRKEILARDNHYWKYNLLITFRESHHHPKRDFVDYRLGFQRYCSKHGIEFVAFPELSPAGRFHIHAIILIYGHEVEVHDRTVRLLRNYIGRKYGWHSMQQIIDYNNDYVVVDNQRFIFGSATTSFEQVWKYIIKDANKFTFWGPVFRFTQHAIVAT